MQSMARHSHGRGSEICIKRICLVFPGGERGKRAWKPFAALEAPATFARHCLPVKTTILRILLIAAFLVAGYFIRQGNSQNLEPLLKEAAEKMNASPNQMMDDDTRLDHVEAGPGKRITYNYTLVRVSKANVNIPELQKAMREQIIANYKTSSQMEHFRRANVEMAYRYKDKAGEPIFELMVSPKDF